MSTGREIRLIEEADGWWSAIDDATGVASQGPTRQEALENLDEAVELTNEAVELTNEAVELTNEAVADETPAPEPDAPWFDS